MYRRFGSRPRTSFTRVTPVLSVANDTATASAAPSGTGRGKIRSPSAVRANWPASLTVPSRSE